MEIDPMLALPFLILFVSIAVQVYLRDDRHRANAELLAQVLNGLALLFVGSSVLFGGEELRLALGNVNILSSDTITLKIALALHLRPTNAVLILMLGLVLPLAYYWLRPTYLGRDRSFYISANILHIGLMGAFLADSLVLFYGFFELALIGAYFWIGLHGVAERGGSREVVSGALTRFLLFTLLGSLSMLASIAVLVASAGSDVRLTQLAEVVASLSPTARAWTLAGFFAAFAVKMPLFPFHGWLRETYHGSPALARTILSAAMSKLGAYGFLVIVCGGYVTVAAPVAGLLQTLALSGIVYGALLCLGVQSMRDVLVYSSLTHLSLIALGMFTALGNDARDGSALGAALFQMFNHGLIMTALFCLEGRISESSEAHTDLRGLKLRLPRLSALLLTAIFVSISLPGAGSFAAELLILFSAYRESAGTAFVALLGLLLSAAAIVRIYHRDFLGTDRTPDGPVAADFSVVETIPGLGLATIWIVTGLQPMLILAAVEGAVLIYR